MLTFEDLDSIQTASKEASSKSKKGKPVFHENKGFISENAELTTTVILDITNLKESFA